jgi:sugar O-acyltransferase (sialic acid O-acetyltransferase NeuD family)
MPAPVIVIGAGGHARVLIDALQRAGVKIIGVCAPELQAGKTGPLGVTAIGGESALAHFDRASHELVNGVGSVGNPESRVLVFERQRAEGWRFATLVHPAATVGAGCKLAEGVQVMAGAVVQPSCHIGVNAIVNSSASIDHDSRLGDHVHVAPGAVLCGNVVVGARTHVGSGAVLIHGITIGDDVLIGAGAVITRSVANGEHVPSGGRY